MKCKKKGDNKLLYAKGAILMTAPGLALTEAISIAKDADIIINECWRGKRYEWEAKAKAIFIARCTGRIDQGSNCYRQTGCCVISAGRPLIFNWTATMFLQYYIPGG
jgi:hypothetical protein